MHLRVRSTPDVVICEPMTSLICPGRARSIVDQDPLAEPQVGNVLLARERLREGGRCDQPQGKAGGQGKASGYGLVVIISGLAHLVLIFSPSGPTLICRPSGSCLAL